MYTSLVRTLRTSSSERFILRRVDADAAPDPPGDHGIPDNRDDVAVLDIHYPEPGRAIGTLILLEGAGLTLDDVPNLLSRLDADILPDVSFEDGTLEFSVVVGRSVGTFVPSEE